MFQSPTNRNPTRVLTARQRSRRDPPGSETSTSSMFSLNFLRLSCLQASSKSFPPVIRRREPQNTRSVPGGRTVMNFVKHTALISGSILVIGRDSVGLAVPSDKYRRGNGVADSAEAFRSFQTIHWLQIRTCCPVAVSLRLLLS